MTAGIMSINYVTGTIDTETAVATGIKAGTIHQTRCAVGTSYKLITIVVHNDSGCFSDYLGNDLDGDSESDSSGNSTSDFDIDSAVNFMSGSGSKIAHTHFVEEANFQLKIH